MAAPVILGVLRESKCGPIDGNPAIVCTAVYFIHRAVFTVKIIT